MKGLFGVRLMKAFLGIRVIKGLFGIRVMKGLFATMSDNHVCCGTVALLTEVTEKKSCCSCLTTKLTLKKTYEGKTRGITPMVLCGSSPHSKEELL